MNAWCWQVNIDAQGLLKVVHMVKLQNSADQEGFQAVSAYSESQASPSCPMGCESDLHVISAETCTPHCSSAFSGRNIA